MINEATEPKCWAHRHMSYTDYGILNVVTAWAYQKSAKVKGTLFFDGLRISNEFSDGCKGTIYKFRDRMVTAGWLIPMDPVVIDPKTGLKIAKRNKRNGKLSSERYRVLKHEEWAAAHPGACELCRAVQHDEEPVHPEGMDGTESSSPRETGPVHLDVSPVHPERLVQFTQTSHQFTQEDITSSELVLGTRAKTRKEEQVVPSACPQALSSSRPYMESEADSGRSASSPRETGPVHLERLVADTPPTVKQGAVQWRGVDEGYVDSVTGRKLFYDDINARIAPNKYENAKFWNPAGEEISLEQAQEKEAVCA
jgi:hypothetical protein